MYYKLYLSYQEDKFIDRILEKVLAAPQLPTSTAVGLAYQGQPVEIGSLKPGKFPTPGAVSVISEYQDYVPDIDVDLTDLSQLNMEISKLRVRLHRIRIELRVAKRKALEKKFVYDSARKRCLIGISGSSSTQRDALADLMVEQEYTDYLVANAVADEIYQNSRDLRTELDALRELSNNQRRQIEIQ